MLEFPFTRSPLSKTLKSHFLLFLDKNHILPRVLCDLQTK